MPAPRGTAELPTSKYAGYTFDIIHGYIRDGLRNLLTHFNFQGVPNAEFLHAFFFHDLA